MADLNLAAKMRVLHGIRKNMDERVGNRLRPSQVPQTISPPGMAAGVPPQTLNNVPPGLQDDDNRRLMEMYSSIK